MELERRRGWAARDGDQELAAEQARRLADLERTEEPDLLLLPSEFEERLAALRMVGITIPDDLDGQLLRIILGEDRVWRERLRGDSAPPADRTIAYHAGRYIDLQFSRQRSGEVSTSDFDQTRQAVEAFRDWLGAETAIDAIDADRWEAWYVHLLGSDLSKETKRNRVRRPRDFIGWLASKGLITAPSNLLTRKFRFKSAIRPFITLTESQVKAFLGAAKGILRLHLLLSLNCGMGATEIATLRQDEVDWATGRIIRKRHKTGAHDTVPVVRYLLWSETAALLRQFRAPRTHELALLTRSGLPWVRDELDEDGKRHRVDAIRSLYAPVARRLSIDKPFKCWRKTAGSKLDAHPEFAGYAQHFLGHSPTDIARKHYVTPDPERFDAAIRWLGAQYGFGSEP